MQGMIKSAFSWMIDRHGEATWIQSKRLMAFDLLPWLAASWMASAIGRQGNSRRQLLSHARFLLELSSQGAVLLLNLPIRHGERLRKWIGNRLFFCLYLLRLIEPKSEHRHLIAAVGIETYCLLGELRQPINFF